MNFYLNTKELTETQFNVGDRAEIARQLYVTNSSKLYILNNLHFLFNKKVLLPSEDTLQLIEIAGEMVKDNQNINTVADLGTGSGIIAISLAINYPNKIFYATDIRKTCLLIAQFNAKINGVENIKFFKNNNGKWLSELKKERLDFLISNPPFIERGEINDEFIKNYPEVKFEPKSAILNKSNKKFVAYFEMVTRGVKLGARRFLFLCNSTHINLLKYELTRIKIPLKVNIIKNKKDVQKFIYLEVV